MSLQYKKWNQLLVFIVWFVTLRPSFSKILFVFNLQMSVVEKEDEGYCQPADSFLTDTIYLSVLLIILTLFLNASCFPDFSVSLN